MEEMMGQPPDATEEMAVDDEQNILGHIHAHHTVHHFCHAPERHIVNEQQVQIGLPCLHRLVDLFFQEVVKCIFCSIEMSSF